MKIEKLNENKIRFILNLDDLKEKNVDYHSFMSNSIETQDLFLDMLDKAEKEVGFITKDYKLMLEAIATSDGNFILTVTRLKPDITPERVRPKKVKIQMKSNTPSKNICIYQFETFDVFCEFCTYLNNSSLKTLINKLKNSILYQYNGSYYLVIHNVTMSLSKLKSMHLIITEFASFASTSELFERKLIEFGKIIISNNAINTCVKYF